MDDLLNFLYFLLILCVGMIIGLIVWGTAVWINDYEPGPIVEKYYDDSDLVCSKTCVRQPECFALVIETEPWYDDRVCVSESYYNTVEVGDTFKGEQ